MPEPTTYRALWPEGRKTIRINEASRLIEPGLGEPPLSEYYKARIAHQHSLEIAPSAREHQRMLDTASLNNDTETYMRLEMERIARIRRQEENDGSLQDAIIRSLRAERDLPREIVRQAKLLNVHLIPPYGVGADEPDETWFLDRAGFEKIREAILSPSVTDG